MWPVRARGGSARVVELSPDKEAIVIDHQIRPSVKPDVPKAELEASLERLRRLGRELDGVQSSVVGRDFGGEFDYGAAALGSTAPALAAAGSRS